MPPHSLSGGAEFGYGCLGGAIAYLAVFVLPELRAMWRDSAFSGLSPWKIAVALLIGAGLTVLGGAAAFLVGDATEAKHAIAYGIGAESIIGGVVKAPPE